MRWSHCMIPTQREAPADAVAPSHILLLRAGMIRQLGSGAYSYLPLGLRVLRKAEKIVREEMDAAGALELLMPALQPADLWRESGRYEVYGDLLMKLKISNQQEMALGPTHEEVVTDIARDLIKSYRQMPVTVYQVQTKFRDEPRPRFGILRTREFVMKDAYSFGTNLDQLNDSYDAMYEAYCRIFDRCGFPYVVVDAESGPIGGDASHEFMVPSSIGEDVVIQCAASGYAANQERAQVGPPPPRPATPADAPAHQSVATPNRRTIQEVAEFLKVKPDATAKLLVFKADARLVAVLIRGDHEANEAKVKRAFGATSLEPAEPDAILKATGAPMGFLGPVGLTIPLAVDQSVAVMPSVIVGGNEVDVHFLGVVPGRDFPLTNVLDLRNAVEGDPCPVSGRPMHVTHGIEVGHVFKLGTKYSKAMNAQYLDDAGKGHPLIMGCYGIGVNRILAAAVESSHDADGILWPLSLAPYTVLVVPLQVNNEQVMNLAQEFEQFLGANGVDVLLDDRDQRPGVKFKDGDLIGIPLRVVIGERGLKSGQIEIKWRHEKDARPIEVETAAQGILDEVQGAVSRLHERCEERRAERAARRAGASTQG